MFCDKSETIKIYRLALVVLTTVFLCVGNAVGQDEKKAESDASAVVAFNAALAKAEGGDAKAMSNLPRVRCLCPPIGRPHLLVARSTVHHKVCMQSPVSGLL